MKRIGILTFIQPQNKNYGAILQAYALSIALKKIGHKVELIDIRNNRENLSQVSRIKKTIREIFEGNVFRLFLKKHVAISKPLYSFDELKAYSNTYYAVIVGSDQVWRPEYSGNLALNYFLDFVPDGIRRIAYAASFGIDQWEYDKSFTKEVIKEIQKFDAISTREISGIDICLDVFNVKSVHVLDPTLLVDKREFYGLLPKQRIKKNNFIASFILDRTNETAAIEAYLSSKTGLFVNSLNKIAKNCMGISWYEFLPINNWLQSIRDANLIITDSFHCVCFSIIFQKKFVCIGNKTRGLARLYSLLQIFSLEHLIFNDIEEFKDSEVWKTEIDYSHIDLILNKHQKFSKEFLTNFLVL